MKQKWVGVNKENASKLGKLSVVTLFGVLVVHPTSHYLTLLHTSYADN